MNKFKILHVIGSLHRGGKERQLTEIVKYLSKLPEFDTRVLVFRKDGGYSDMVKKAVDKFYYIPKRPTKLEPFLLIRSVFEEFRPDVVHTWDTISSVYTYMQARKYKVKFIDGSIRDSGVRKGWKYSLARLFFNKADLVLANSFAGLKYYNVQGEVVYNAIDLKRFECSVSCNSEFNIIKSASFSDYKDHQTFLVAAIRLLDKKIIDNVYLAGDGVNKKKYVNLINENYPHLTQRIHFLGSIDNVEKYLAKCKVGVLCSTSKYSEGVSNSVLEYMASGLVAISSNVGGNSEIIENGVNGYLVDEKDSNGIYNIVCDLKKNAMLMEEIIDKGIETVCRKFSFEANIGKLIKLYTA